MERSIKVSTCIFSNELRRNMTILFSTLINYPSLESKKNIKSVPFTALRDGLACFCSSHSVLSPFRLSVGCLDGEEELIQYHICFQILLRLVKGLPGSYLHVKPLHLAGQLWAFLTKFSGHCTFSLLLLFWRSKY